MLPRHGQRVALQPTRRKSMKSMKNAGQTPLQHLVKLYERSVDKGDYQRAELLQIWIAVAIQEEAQA